MRLHGIVPAVLALWLGAAAPLAAQATVEARPAPRAAAADGAVERAVAGITAAALQRDVEFLASDELRGRDTPSPGLEKAAAWLEAELRAAGLQPGMADGSFVQRFPLQHVELDVANLVVTARGAADTLRPSLGRDLFVLPSRAGMVEGAPLYAGRARPGASLGDDVAGRIVVFFVPDTIGPAWQASVASAMQAAFRAQAGAAVLVLDSVFPAATVGELARELAASVAPLPIIGLSYETGRSLFRAAGMELGAVSNRSGPPAAMRGVALTISAPAKVEVVAAPNVVAVVRGSDPVLRDEYVVYSAHFDHVGVGAPDAQGDSIFNGADDNASGTSAVLAAARAFAALPQAPARSVMFVFVSGEEKGLLGSRHFVEQPPVPVERMVANINADMIGRNAPDTVVAIGQDYSSLGPLVQSIAARHPELGLVVAPDLWPEEQLFFRSDHFSFAARGVPAIFFTTGLHDEYHQPSDEAHLIDTDKLERVARLLFRLGHEIAQEPVRPEWTERGRSDVGRATGGR